MKSFSGNKVVVDLSFFDLCDLYCCRVVSSYKRFFVEKFITQSLYTYLGIKIGFFQSAGAGLRGEHPIKST